MRDLISSDLDDDLTAAIADTLDCLSAAMFLVDPGGRIIHANSAGHAALAKGDVVRHAGARLAAREAEDDRNLLVAFAAAGSGNAATGNKGVAVPLNTSDGTRHVAHVLPLTCGARRRAGTTYAAAAAVFVNAAELGTSSMSGFITKTYKLTPTELRILLAIVEVGGVHEVATALGISENTVKTHLGRLFEKTGARRQCDLVKFVAGFSNPLVG